MPFTILLASAGVVAAGEALVRLAQQGGASRAIRVYARGVALSLILAYLTVASGQTLRLPELTQFRVEGYTSEVFRFPDLQGPAQYVKNHWRKDDIILATDPFQVNYL